MSRLWIHFSFLLFLSFGSFALETARGQGPGTLGAEVETIIQELQGVSDKSLSSRQERHRIREIFARASRLYVKVLNHPELEDQTELKLTEKLSVAIAKAFAPIADEFKDAKDDSGLLKAHESATNGFLKFVYKHGGRFLFAGQQLFVRDLGSAFWPYHENRWMIPPGLPLVGRDAAVNRLVKGIFRDLEGAFQEEFKEAGQDKEKIEQARLSLTKLTEELLVLEPVRYGPWHRIVALTYLVVLAPLAFHNPLELWPVRTEYGPDVFGVLEAAFFVWMYKVRLNNSGLQAFSIFNRLRKMAGLPKLGPENCAKNLKRAHFAKG